MNIKFLTFGFLLILCSYFVVPGISLAQSNPNVDNSFAQTQGQSSGGSSFGNFNPSSGIPGLVTWMIGGINAAVPLVFALAFVVFIWGVFTYFIAGGANEEKRSEGSKFIIYSVIGFAVMLSLWGLVSLVTTTFGTGGSTAPSYPTLPKPAG